MLAPTVELAKTARTANRNREAERHLLQILDLAPTHLEALRLLFELRRAEGRVTAAEALIRRICRLEPRQTVAFLQYGQLLVGQNRHAEAEAPAREALKLSPRESAPHHMIGMIFTETRRLLAGERHYRLAFDFAERRDPAILANLAWNLRQQGRLDEAATIYRSALELKADNARALSGFAQVEAGRGNLDRAEALIAEALQHAPNDRMIRMLGALGRLHRGDPAGCIERIEATAADIAPQPLVATELAAKGQAFERLGQINEAFTNYDAARAFQRERAGKRFDPAPIDARLAALRATFMSDRLSGLPRPPTPPGSPIPVFLLGSPRSGTSLLEQLLSLVPGIDPLDARGPLPELSQLLPKLIAGLGGPELGFPEAVTETIAGEARDALPMLVVRYINALRLSGAITAETRFVTDRCADLPWILGLAALLFSDAPVIHVLRHPLDVTLSIFAQDRLYEGNAGVSLESAARLYDATMSAISHVRGQMTLRYLPIRYETIVLEPAVSLRRILDFLGVAADPETLLAAPPRTTPRVPAHQTIRESVHRRSLYRYRNFAPRLDGVLPILKPWIETLGYEMPAQRAA